jgi:hypothetical protein
MARALTAKEKHLLVSIYDSARLIGRNTRAPALRAISPSLNDFLARKIAEIEKELRSTLEDHGIDPFTPMEREAQRQTIRETEGHRNNPDENWDEIEGSYRINAEDEEELVELVDEVMFTKSLPTRNRLHELETEWKAEPAWVLRAVSRVMRELGRAKPYRDPFGIRAQLATGRAPAFAANPVEDAVGPYAIADAAGRIRADGYESRYDAEAGLERLSDEPGSRTYRIIEVDIGSLEEPDRETYEDRLRGGRRRKWVEDARANPYQGKPDRTLWQRAQREMEGKYDPAVINRNLRAVFRVMQEAQARVASRDWDDAWRKLGKARAGGEFIKLWASDTGQQGERLEAHVNEFLDLLNDIEAEGQDDPDKTWELIGRANKELVEVRNELNVMVQWDLEPTD